MEAFPSMKFEDILDRYDWRNITLLMYDKLKYVGNKDEKDKEPGPIMDEKEEKDFFEKLLKNRMKCQV